MRQPSGLGEPLEAIAKLFMVQGADLLREIGHKLLEAVAYAA